MDIKTIAGKGLFFLSLQVFVLIGTQDFPDVCNQPCPTSCHLQKSALYLAATGEGGVSYIVSHIHALGPYSQCMVSLYKAKYVLH